MVVHGMTMLGLAVFRMVGTWTLPSPQEEARLVAAFFKLAKEYR